MSRLRVLFWWLLSVAPFFSSPALEAIVITEIFYHPGPDDPDEALEFVEIHNEGSIVADISGYFFSTGIQFVFPENTFLAAGDYLVVCRNEDAVRLVYGIDNLLGNFVGRLDNGGETLQLVTPNGSLVAEVDYDDRDLWPAVADATGYTLSILNPLHDPDRPGHWTRSARPGGTPGANNFPPAEVIEHEVFSEREVWRFREGWNQETGEISEFSDPPQAWQPRI
jgi:hypothetical protein